jgi:mitochondrial chaperone BCS1
MTRDRRIMNALLLEAKKGYNAEQDTNVCIYVSDSFNEYWRHVACRPKRALSSIVLDPGIAERVIGDARDFLSSRAWYARRGIPFRRGYLLYGAPGSGKTSLIHSLAGELGLNVYVISLSQSGMDDNKLARLIADLPERCIALMEDIDAAFHHGLNRDPNSPEPAMDPSGKPIDPAQAQSSNPNTPPPPPAGSRITLSGLLNALDGVGAQEGRILFATTNKYASLDPALCRPGRMDLHVEFKLASRYQAGELFKCFYIPDDEAEESKEEKKKKEKKEKEDETSSEKSIDSGYGSISPDGVGDATSPDVSATPTSSDSATESVQGTAHSRQRSTLSKAQALALATRFSQALPEREFSMAALQGYLMMYKTSPVEAMENVTQWVEKELKERDEKAKKSQAKVNDAAKVTTSTSAPKSDADATKAAELKPSTGTAASTTSSVTAEQCSTCSAAKALFINSSLDTAAKDGASVEKTPSTPK